MGAGPGPKELEGLEQLNELKCHLKHYALELTKGKSCVAYILPQ